MVLMDTTAPNDIQVVDALHPSLDDQLDRFFDELHDEPRYFGPSASDNPPETTLLAAVER